MNKKNRLSKSTQKKIFQCVNWQDHVSRTLIKITVDPENKAKRAAYSREYLKAHPVSKEKRNEYARNHRHYKKELYETGKINEAGEKNE